jgi:hypothetical protein
MGGRIWAKRAASGGTEVGFTLRVVEPDPADAEDGIGILATAGPTADSETPTSAS